MTDIRQIEQLLAPSIEGMGFRLIRVTYGGGSRPVLQVMAEPLELRAMTVDDCADISRTISAVLDVADPISSNYQLEVTSPGIDRPLVDRADFARFAGFEAKIELSRPHQGRKRFKGRVAPVDADDLVPIHEAEGTVSVPYDAILKAKLILTDDLIKATQSPSPPATGLPLSAAG